MSLRSVIRALLKEAAEDKLIDDIVERFLADGPGAEGGIDFVGSPQDPKNRVSLDVEFAGRYRPSTWEEPDYNDTAEGEVSYIPKHRSVDFYPVGPADEVSMATLKRVTTHLNRKLSGSGEKFKDMFIDLVKSGDIELDLVLESPGGYARVHPTDVDVRVQGPIVKPAQKGDVFGVNIIMMLTVQVKDAEVSDYEEPERDYDPDY